MITDQLGDTTCADIVATLTTDQRTMLLAMPHTGPFRPVFRELRVKGLISATIAPGWTEWDHVLTERGEEVRRHLEATP